MTCNVYTKIALFFIAIVLVLPVTLLATEVSAASQKQLIYDYAGLLNQEEVIELEAMAHRYGAKRETDIIILTTNNAENADVVKLTENFFDEHGLGYDKQHGNTVIITLDMKNRDVYLAGFYKAKQYLDDGRLDKIRNKITPDLSNGDYELAIRDYIKTSYKYMGIRPGVNPDLILFNGWFQLAVSLGIAGIIVSIMAFHTGGRVTVHRKTYEDSLASGILQQEDRYIRTTTSKVRIPRNNSGSGMRRGGGGGGGGFTGGGHSHSGSRGKF